MDGSAAGRQHRHAERRQRRLRLHAPGRCAAAPARRGAVHGGRQRRAGRQGVQRGCQPARAGGVGRGRAAQPPLAAAAVANGGAAQRRRRSADHRLRHRPAASPARARRAAARAGPVRPENRIGHRRPRRAPVQLPELRLAHLGATGQHAGRDVPAVPPRDRPEQRDWRRAEARAPGAAGHARAGAGQHRPLSGRKLAAGGLSAPQRQH